jgi:putative peptide zinc metalloprotease protein
MPTVASPSPPPASPATAHPARAVPARRRDLIVRPSGEGGQHVVKDPDSGAYYNLGPEESFLFACLNGRNSRAAVRRGFEQRFGSALAEEDLDEFLALARASGFLATAAQANPPGREAPAAESVGERSERTARATTADTRTAAPAPATARPRQSLLYWRKSVFDPDRFFTWLEPKIRFVWTRAFVAASAACVVAAMALVWANRHELVTYFPQAFNWETALLVWLALVVATTLHEFAHGLTCKHFGGEVHEVGFLLMFFLPCFYCNVSDAWLIRERSRRLWVTLAGGYCDLCLWALAAFTWRVTLQDTLPNYLAWVVLSVCGVRVFFNFNPLIKLDGYYLLSDLADIPNLRQRGWDRLMAHVRWLLWGAPRPAAEPRGRFLLTFGLAAWLYSVAFLGLMTVGFAKWWGHQWGTAGTLAALALGAVTARGMAQGLTNGEVKRMVLSRRQRVLAWVGAVGAVALALSFVPIQDRAGGAFRLRSARRAELRAPVAGFLGDVRFDEGQAVPAGAVVLRIEVPDLASQLARKRAEVAEAEAKWRLQQAGPVQQPDPARASVVREVRVQEVSAAKALVERLTEELRYLESQSRRQTVASPVGGLLVTPRLAEKVGRFFREGELICEVEDPAALEAEIAVPEHDAARVSAGQVAWLKARAAPFRTVRAEVTGLAPVARYPYERGEGASGGGGGAAAPPQAAGVAAGEMPGAVSVYCTLRDPPPALRPGMTGYARIDCGRAAAGRVLVKRVLRYVRTEFWW